MRWRASSIGLCGLCLLSVLGGCDTTVATLPEDRARRVLRALEQVQLPATARRIGNQIAISVQPEERPYAQSVILAVDLPRAPVAEPTLVQGPTAARLAARERARQSLEATLAALPDLLGARLADDAGVWVAVITTLPDRPDVAQQVRGLLGPTARIAIRPIDLIRRRAAPRTATDRSPVLLGAIGVLVLTVLALLANIRRLRRDLGQ